MVRVTVLQYRNEAFVFAVVPGFQSWALLSPALRGNGKNTRVSDRSVSCAGTPLVDTPLFAYPLYHTRLLSHPLQSKIPLLHPLFTTPPVTWPSLFALVSKRCSFRTNTPKLSHPLVSIPPSCGQAPVHGPDRRGFVRPTPPPKKKCTPGCTR